MHRTLGGFLVLLAVLSSTARVHAQHTERGAVLGGIAGALTGAAIGDRNDEAGAGALIGGAVGLVTGAMIGQGQDQRQARYRYQQARQQAAFAARAISLSDVVTMTQGGVSDAVILNQIRQNGVQRELEVSDVIFLHRQGVSETVITALQRAPAGYRPAPVAVVRPAPPVVVRHTYVPPPVWPTYRVIHHHPPRPSYRCYGPRPPRSSFHLHIRN